MLWVVSAKFPRRALYRLKYYWTRAFMLRVLIFMLQQYMHLGPLFFLGSKRTKRKLLASGEYSWTGPMISVLVKFAGCRRLVFPLSTSPTPYQNPRLTDMLLEKIGVQIWRQGPQSKSSDSALCTVQHSNGVLIRHKTCNSECRQPARPRTILVGPDI